MFAFRSLQSGVGPPMGGVAGTRSADGRSWCGYVSFDGRAVLRSVDGQARCVVKLTSDQERRNVASDPWKTRCDRLAAFAPCVDVQERDAMRLAVAFENQVHVLARADDRWIEEARMMLPSRVLSLAWSGDARGMAICDEQGGVSRWTRRASEARWTMRERKEFQTTPQRCACAQTVVSPVAFHRSGEVVRVWCDDGRVHVLPNTDHALHLAWRHRRRVGTEGLPATSGALQAWETDEGHQATLLVQQNDGSIRLWMRTNGGFIPSESLHTETVTVCWVEPVGEPEHGDLSFVAGINKNGNVQIWVAMGLSRQRGQSVIIAPWKILHGVFANHHELEGVALIHAELCYVSDTKLDRWRDKKMDGQHAVDAQWNLLAMQEDGLLSQVCLQSSTSGEAESSHRILQQVQMLVAGHIGDICSLDTLEGRLAVAVDESGQALIWAIPCSVPEPANAGAQNAPLVCKGRIPGARYVSVVWIEASTRGTTNVGHQQGSPSKTSSNCTCLLGAASSTGVDIYEIWEGCHVHFACHAPYPEKQSKIHTLFTAHGCLCALGQDEVLHVPLVYTWSLEQNAHHKWICVLQTRHSHFAPLSAWATVVPPSPFQLVLGHTDGSITLLCLKNNSDGPYQSTNKCGYMQSWDKELQFCWEIVGQVVTHGSPVSGIAVCPGGGRIAVHFDRLDRIAILQAEAASDAIYLHEGEINLEAKVHRGRVHISWLDAGGTYPLLLVGSVNGMVQCFLRCHVQLSPFQPWRCLASYMDGSENAVGVTWANGGLPIAALGPNLHVLSPHLQILSGRAEVANLLPPGKVHKGVCSIFTAASALSGAVPVYFPTVLRKLVVQGSFYYVRSVLRCMLHCLQGGGKIMDGISMESMLRSNSPFAAGTKSGLISAADGSGAEEFTTREAKDLNELLEDARLRHTGLAQVGLQRDALLSLQAIATHLAELDGGSQPMGLDNPGKRFYRTVRAKQIIRQRVTDAIGRQTFKDTVPGSALAVRAQVGEQPIVVGMQDAAWAVLSGGEDLLLNNCIAEQKQMPWEVFEGLKGGFWVRRREFLRSKCEQFARLKYAKTKDPEDCVLLYVALRRLNVLQGLYKVAGNKKFVEFFSRDFSLEENRIAALKNAHALLSQHRYELAAAFFYLGDAPDHAMTVLAKQAGQIQLAIVTCRLWELSGHQQFRTMLDTVLVPIALANGDRWLLSILYLLKEDAVKAAMCIGRINVHSHESCRIQKGDEFAADYCQEILGHPLFRIPKEPMKRATKLAALRAAFAWEAYGIPLQALEALRLWRIGLADASDLAMQRSGVEATDPVVSGVLDMSAFSMVDYRSSAKDSPSEPATPSSFEEEAFEAEAASEGYMQTEVQNSILESWSARLGAACLTRPYATGRVMEEDVPESVIAADIGPFVNSHFGIESEIVQMQMEKFTNLLRSWKIGKVSRHHAEQFGNINTSAFSENKVGGRQSSLPMEVSNMEAGHRACASAAVKVPDSRRIQGKFEHPGEVAHVAGELLYAICSNPYNTAELVVSTDLKGFVCTNLSTGAHFSSTASYFNSFRTYGRIWRQVNARHLNIHSERNTDVENGPNFRTTCTRTLDSHPFSDLFASGSLAPSSSSNKSVYLWQFDASVPVQQYCFPGPSDGAHFSPAAKVRFDDFGDRLACMTFCGHVAQWGIANACSHASLPLYMQRVFTGTGRDLVFINGHSSLLAVAGSSDKGCSLHLLDLLSPPCKGIVASLDVHGGQTRTLATWSRSAVPKFVSGGGTGMIMAHDIRQDGQYLWSTKACDEGKISCLAVGQFELQGATRDIVAYGTQSGSVGVLDAKTGKSLQDFPGVHERKTFLNPRGAHALSVHAVTDIKAIENEGLVSCGADGFVKLFKHV